jgi:hypothetical protein
MRKKFYIMDKFITLMYMHFFKLILNVVLLNPKEANN